MGLLRLLLAISVVLEHSGAIFGVSLVGGQIAVQAFYIISGFYMSLILNEKYIGKNNSYSLFITNRFLRLYPVYWVVLILTLAFFGISAILSHGQKLGTFAYYVDYIHSMNFASIAFLVFTNIFLFFQDIVMFLGLDKITGNLFFSTDYHTTSPMLFKFLFIPQAWTIGVELAFYLIAPFLVKRKNFILLMLVLLSIGLRVILVKSGLNKDPWSYRFFPTELVFFLLGIISYRIYLAIGQIKIKALYLFFAYSIILIFTLIFSFTPREYTYYGYLGLFFIALPFIFKLTKKWKWDAIIGDLSYPIYISHIFVLSVICKFLTAIDKKDLGLILTIGTILFSILLNKVIAKRIEKIRQARIKKD